MTRFYLIILAIITLLNINSLESQEIVFNEYSRDYLENHSSIELLVIEDYLDMRGFYLRDSYNDVWQSGVRFKYNAIWKNIKSGTCIVIDFGSKITSPTDEELKNGIIKVSINNQDYFEYTDSDLTIDSSKKGLFSIEEDSNVLQILDKGKNSVHIASHGLNSSSLFNNLPQPKLHLSKELSYGFSWCVFPGKDIESYHSLYTANVILTSKTTIGEANTLYASSDYNADFWHELRKPKYETLNLSIKQTSSYVALYWDRIDIEDSYNQMYGYLILYGPKSEVSQYLYVAPIDGLNYQKGEFVKQWKVLDNLVGASKNYYDAEGSFDSNDYIFKVVPYAFVSKKDEKTYSGLGTAYNDKEEVVQANNSDPLTKVNLISNYTYLVNNQTVNINYYYASNHTTKWYKTSNPDSILSNSNNSLSVTESGNYYALLYNNNKQVAFTDTVEIKDLNLSMKLDNTEIKSDTNFYRCSNFVNKLSVEIENNDCEIWWYKNSTKIEEGKSIYVSSLGNYSCRLVQNNKVIWQSYIISIREKQVALIPSETEMILPNNSRIIFWLENKSNESILVEKQDFQLGEPFEFNVETELPAVLEKNQKLQCEIRYFNKLPKKDTTYGHLYFVDECGTTKDYLIKGYNNITEPKVILSSNVLKFGQIRNCKYDTLDIEYGIQGLEGSILTLNSDSPAYLKAEFENGKNSIHVENIKTNKIYVLTHNANIPEGNYKANIDISARKENNLMFIDTINVYASVAANPYIISALYDKLFYCNNEEYQYIPVLISNTGTENLRFTFPNTDSLDCNIHNLDLTPHTDTVLHIGMKYSENGYREINILEEQCNTITTLDIFTEMTEFEHDSEINLDISSIYDQKVEFELKIEAKPMDLLNFLTYMCPKHIQYLDSKIQGNIVKSRFSTDLSKLKGLKDSIFIGNAYCQEKYIVYINYIDNKQRIANVYDLKYYAKPLENMEQFIEFNLPNNTDEFVIDKISIDSEKFKVAENQPIPLKLTGQTHLKINYTNTFSSDTATLILYYSEPYEFEEKIILYGSIEDDFKLQTQIDSDPVVYISNFDAQAVSGTINLKEEYIDFIDTLFFSINYDKENYNILPASIKINDKQVNQNMEAKEGKIIIQYLSQSTLKSDTKFEFLIEPQESIFSEIDSISFDTYYTIKNMTSDRETATSIVDATELFENIKSTSLNGKWVSLTGNNPVYGRASYEVRSSIDKVLDIYLINDLGEKYYLNVDRHENIYYFNMDVKDIPLGVYTVVVKAQSKIFSNRIILME